MICRRFNIQLETFPQAVADRTSGSRATHETPKPSAALKNPGNALPLQDRSVEVWPRRAH